MLALPDKECNASDELRKSANCEADIVVLASLIFTNFELVDYGQVPNYPEFNPVVVKCNAIQGQEPGMIWGTNDIRIKTNWYWWQKGPVKKWTGPGGIASNGSVKIEADETFFLIMYGDKYTIASQTKHVKDKTIRDYLADPNVRVVGQPNQSSHRGG